MPGPPPPAPPPPGPPPPPLSLPKMGGGGADDRGALLKSIRQGAKLKKTVTNDKSAPMIAGKISSTSNNNSPSSGGSTLPNSSNHSVPNGMALGGLFAGGMPKLKSTGRLGASTLNSSNNSSSNNNYETDKISSPKVAPSKNFNSIQDQLKRQLHNPSDTRMRGPPPPAPTRNISVDESKGKTLVHNNSNGLHLSQTSIHGNVSSLHCNNSTLHRKSKSNANLSSLDCTDNVNNGTHQPSKPVINHGKPNLAPKPPILNGKPAPPTKLAVKTNKTISRAQSMRTPRSPSPQSPTPNNDASIKFGTVRNMSSIIGQSLTNLNSQHVSPRPRPALMARPTVPPPSVPPPSAPASTLHAPAPKQAPVRPPNHAPPPPPGIPQPPSHAPPPPPPHKTQTLPQPIRPPPAVPTNNSAQPPPPPPRHSSMRDVNQQPRRSVVDLEEKFKGAFSTPDRFPRPPPYRNVLKLYSNRQATSKQQAPLPPPMQPPNRIWNPTSTC